MPELYAIRLLKVGTDQYQAELRLRDEVLRKPLGMSIYDELPDDNNDHHLGYFCGTELVGVLLLTEINEVEVKMRQVAVAEAWRGMGIGTRLVKYAEKYAQSLGYRRIRLHARKTAVGFYAKLAYRIIGNEFVEVGLPHYEMVKELT